MAPMRIFIALLAGLTLWSNSQTWAADCGLYEYRAEIVDVYDADTVTADVDLGFDIWIRNERFRLYNLNAPEVRGEEKAAGIRSRDALREKILGRSVIICSIKDRKGKYGRYLAEIYLDGENINDWLIENGFAVYQEY